MPAQQLFVQALNKNFPDSEIIIVAFQYPYSEGSYKWHGNHVISFNNHKKGLLHRLCFWIKIWRTLNKINRSLNIGGILSLWCTETAFIGKYFGWVYGIKHLCWILGQDARKPNKYVRLIRPKAQELIALSDAIGGEFYKNYGILPANVIPNGIEISVFPNTPVLKDIDVLGAGNLVPLKQYDVFIEVVNEIKNAMPSIKTIICGKGEEREQLDKMVMTLGLKDQVKLNGQTPYIEVLKIMQRSKIFLHPSSYEGFSSACLEALYAGAHVVSFVNPMKGAIKNWHVVPDKKAMVEKVMALLQDEKTIYEYVLVYSIDDAAKKMIKLFGF